METLSLQNSVFASAYVTSSAETGRPRTSGNVHRRIDAHNSGSALYHRAALRRTLRPCRSFSIESAATTAPDQPGPSTQSVESVDVHERIVLLKKAAKTKKVPPTEVLSALCAVEKAKLDPSSFLATLGGSFEAPGARTWMLVFTSNKEQTAESFKGGTGRGNYFPVTAVQKFDATAMTIQNGVYLGPLGCLTFEGRIGWKNRILAFLFDSFSIKIGSFGPFKFNIARKEDLDRVPTNKDPFFVWHYADEEIIVARGRGGGLAFWCRCKQVAA